ncbi:MAG: hypothetical protein ABW221_14185 [Vicinamibacteria bacterium]
MRVPWVPLLLVAAAAPAASALEIRHEPVPCAVPDAYVRITARAVPSEGAASGEVRFRARAGDWYTVRMVSSEGEWRASLPRPLASLPRFEYQASLTGTDAQSASTAPIAVEVRSDCPAAGAVAVSPIAVQVPPGAPLVPPVPAGFSPVGATGPAVVKGGGHRGLKILGGAVVAAAGAGLATVVGSSTPAVSTAAVFPVFSFDGTFPPPGSTIHAREGLTVFVRMTPQPDRPLVVPWAVHLLSPDGAPCASMYNRQNALPSETRLALHAVLSVTASRCGPNFEVGSVRLVVGTDDLNAEGQVLPLKYRYEG